MLRIATFNVHHGRGNDGKVDLERTASTILETAADLVALQELDRDVRRSGHVDQPARLQELTGMVVRFFPTAHYGGGEFGLGVAMKERWESHPQLLPRTPFDRRHGVIRVRVGDVEVLATHLSRMLPSRLVEVSRLFSICRQLRSPKVVLGDFNMSGPGLTSMRLAGVAKTGGLQPTFPSERPSRQPDHVLVSTDLRTVRAFTVESAASDHLPLVVEVERRSG